MLLALALERAAGRFFRGRKVSENRLGNLAGLGPFDAAGEGDNDTDAFAGIVVMNQLAFVGVVDIGSASARF